MKIDFGACKGKCEMLIPRFTDKACGRGRKSACDVIVLRKSAWDYSIE